MGWWTCSALPPMAWAAEFCKPTETLAAVLSGASPPPQDVLTSLPTPSPPTSPPPASRRIGSAVSSLPISIAPLSKLNYLYRDNNATPPPFIHGNTEVPFVDCALKKAPPSSSSSLVFEMSGLTSTGKTSAACSLAAQFVLSNYHAFHDAVLVKDEGAAKCGMAFIADTEFGVTVQSLRRGENWQA